MAMIEKNKNDSSNSSDQPAKIKPEADQTYNTQT